MTSQSKQHDEGAITSHYEQSGSLSRTAKHFNISRTTVRRLAVSRGLKINPPGSPRVEESLTDCQLEEARSLVQNDGYGYLRLAKHFGISLTYANNVRHMFGRTPREAKVVRSRRVIEEMRDELRETLLNTGRKSLETRQILEERLTALNHALDRLRYIKRPKGEVL